MSDTIDNLSIEITSNADKAAASLDRLASSADKLKGAAKGAGENARDMKDEVQDMGNATKEAGEQSGEAAKKVRNFGKDAKESGNAAKKGTSGITAFWQSLKRIAFYRFIRTVLKEITEAFSEGIKNLYQWSSAVNGRFAKSMDRIATSTLYLKNSLGAMLAPIINTLAPVIEWIIDRIVDVINWINKLFSALSGSQTYTVAKKVATTWDDAGKKAAGSAKHAADDIKRTILGFDEINKLEKQNTSSSGGGSGSSSDGIDYTNMFEERRLDGWMSRLASFIDRFKLQIPAVFGTLLGGFAAVKLAISGLAKMSGAWLKSLTGKAISIAVSLVRSGWSTLKGWVLSFGKAIVDVAVKIKTTAAELWSAFALKWAALPTVLQVGIVITTTAAVLWGLYKLAWALVPDKMVEIEATIKTKAADLWRNFKRDWAALGEKIMVVSLTIATSAMILWQNFKRDWAAIGEKVMAVGISIATSAVTLWRDFKRDWARAGQKVLTFSLNIATKAQTLWSEFKRDWKQTVTDAVTFGVQISTSAQLVWARFKQAWANVTGKVVSFGLSIANTAESIWLWFTSSWALVNSKVLTFSLGIAETAQSIWNSFKEGWNTAKETLSFAVNPVVSPSASTSAPVPSASTTGKNWRQYLLAALGLGVSIFTGVPAFAESGAAAGFGVNDGVMNSYRNQQQIGNWFADRAPSSSKPSGVGRSSVLADRQSNSLVNDTKNMMSDLLKAFNDGWKAINESVKKSYGDMFYGLFSTFSNAILTTIPNKMQGLLDVMAKGWSEINSVVKAAYGDMFYGLFSTFSNAILTTIPNKMSGLNNAFGTGWQRINNTTSTFMTQMQYVVLNAVNNLGSVVPSRFVSLANAIANVGWDGVGRQVVYGIGNGINYAWPWLRTLVYNLANAMYRAARNALGIHSPSKLFSDGVGMMIGLGVAEGIDNSAPVVMDALNSINESMRNSLTPFTGVSDYIEAAAGSAAVQYAEQANGQMDNAREIALLQSMLNEMRRLNEKEFTAEVTSSSVQRALNRSNLRAGVTVVPVGT